VERDERCIQGCPRTRSAVCVHYKEIPMLEAYFLLTMLGTMIVFIYHAIADAMDP
jgi:hypothetical protein